MIQAGVITKVVDPDALGSSGFSGWRDREAIERRLAGVPIYAVIKEHDPEAFENLATHISAGLQAGRSMNEIVQEVQAVFTRDVLPKYMRMGPDTELVDYFNSQIAEMEYLNRTDPPRCLEFLFPELRQTDFNPMKLVPEALAQQDFATLAALIRATVQRPNHEKGKALGQDLKYVVDRVVAQSPQSGDVLREPLKYLKQPKLVCSTFIAYFKQIVSIPSQRSGPILRELLSK
jgi:hypothetical protein